MGWKDVLAAIFGALKELTLGFFLGQSRQQLEDLHNELEAVEAAAKAAGRVDVMSDGDVLRELQQRGLYRVSGKSTDSK